MRKQKRNQLLSGVALAVIAGGPSVAQEVIETGEGVEITDQVLVIGERSLGLQREREAVNKKSVLETEKASDLPDINAAEAIQRLPGIYIDEDRGEGRFVSVRGANSTFNQVTLNGLQLGSPESNGLSVPLDVFPPGALAAIEVTKSTTPSQSASAVGGSIELSTPTILGNDKVNSEVSFRGGFHGLGGGKRIRARGSTGKVFGDNDQFAISINGSYSVRNLLAETIETTDSDLEDELFDAMSGDDIDFASLGFGDEVWVIDSLEYRNQEVRRERISVGGVLEWKPQEQSRVFAQLNFSRFEEDEFRQLKEFELEDGAGAVTNDSNLVISDFSSFSSIAEEMSLSDESSALTFPSVTRGVFADADEATDVQFQRDFTPQNFWIGALGYEWAGDVWDFRVNGGYSRTTEYRVRDRLNGEGGVTTFLFDATGDPQAPSVDIQSGDDVLNDPSTVDFDDFQIDEDFRFDEVYTFSADARRFMDLWGNPLEVAVGGRVTLRNREINESDVAYDPDLFATLADIPGFAAAGVNTDFFDGRGFGYGTTRSFIESAASDPEGVLGAEFDDPDEADLFGGDSEANEDIYAGYFEALYKAGKLTLLGGVRVEHTEFSIDAFQALEIDEDDGVFADIEAITPVSAETSYTNVFPSAHLRYDLTDELIFRASAAKTLRRPNFNDLIPSGDVAATIDLATPDDDNQSIELDIGNPGLTPLISWNYEASLDWYSDVLGYIGVAVFYKDISDITVTNVVVETVDATGVPEAVSNNIDASLLTGTFEQTTSTVNSSSDGEIFGVEIAYSKKFEELPGFLGNFGVDANVTITDSEQVIPIFDGVDVIEEVTIPFEGQSPLSGNITLAYEDGPLSVRLTNAFTKGFLGDFGFESADPFVSESIYDRDFSRWGGRVEYEIRDNIELSVAGNNFNNRLLRRLRNGDVNTFRETERNGYWIEFGVAVEF
ncbi:MAG: TonB-dependent receptor [Pseudomonadota bacterium]